jgi:hypothetical protein
VLGFHSGIEDAHGEIDVKGLKDFLEVEKDILKARRWLRERKVEAPILIEFIKKVQRVKEERMTERVMSGFSTFR